jgi:hypothetical protein
MPKADETLYRGNTLQRNHRLRGEVVHKAAQEFGVDDDDDTVYPGVVVSYSAGALKWTVQYDHGSPLSTEEYTQQQVTTHHRGILRDEDSARRRSAP